MILMITRARDNGYFSRQNLRILETFGELNVLISDYKWLNIMFGDRY